MTEIVPAHATRDAGRFESVAEVEPFVPALVLRGHRAVGVVRLRTRNAAAVLARPEQAEGILRRELREELEPLADAFVRHAEEGDAANFAVLRWLAFATEAHDHVRIVALEDDVADLEVPLFALAKPGANPELDAKAIGEGDGFAGREFLLLLGVEERPRFVSAQLLRQLDSVRRILVEDLFFDRHREDDLGEAEDVFDRLRREVALAALGLARHTNLRGVQGVEPRADLAALNRGEGAIGKRRRREPPLPAVALSVDAADAVALAPVETVCAMLTKRHAADARDVLGRKAFDERAADAFRFFFGRVGFRVVTIA